MITKFLGSMNAVFLQLKELKSQDFPRYLMLVELPEVVGFIVQKMVNLPRERLR